MGILSSRGTRLQGVRGGARAVFARFALACLATGVATPGATADFTYQASSSAYGASISSPITPGVAPTGNLQLNLLGNTLVQAGVAAQPEAAGVSTTSYNVDQQVASLSTSGGSYGLGFGTVNLSALSTGVMDSRAISNLPSLALPGGGAQGISTVNNLNLALAPTLLANLVAIGSTSGQSNVITSTSTIGGTNGALSAVGSTTLTNVTLSVLGVSVALPTGTIAANTGLSLGGIAGLPTGISIILNEQIVNGNATSGLSLITNAIDIRFNNVGLTGLGTLNGQIVIGHSAAALSAVPEPGSLALLGLGGAGLGLVARRRRARAASRA